MPAASLEKPMAHQPPTSHMLAVFDETEQNNGPAAYMGDSVGPLNALFSGRQSQSPEADQKR